jgi:NADH dehydrogenase FAD-containing subunit
MSEVSSQKAKDYLQKSGVMIMLKTIVKEYDRKQIMLQDATIIESTVVI